MNTQHTPGPWGVSRLATPDYAPEFGIFRDDRGGAPALARVMNENSEANAALIAAAPLMLAALQELADMVAENYESLGYATAPAALRRAQAAITAAEEKT